MACCTGVVLNPVQESATPDCKESVRGFGFEAFTVFRSAAQSLVKSFYYRTLQIETGEREKEGGEVVERGHLPRGNAPISNSSA